MRSARSAGRFLLEGIFPLELLLVAFCPGSIFPGHIFFDHWLLCL